MGGEVEIKRHITYFCKQIELWVAPKKEVEKLRKWIGPNTGCFSSWWLLLCMRKFAPKKLKNNFFLIYVISFKGSCTLLHCFYILRNLKLVFTHFTFTNLPWCSQSMNSLMHVYSIQIHSWSQTWSHFFVLLPPKNISVLPSDGSPVLTLEFRPTRAAPPLQRSRGIS